MGRLTGTETNRALRESISGRQSHGKEAGLAGLFSAAAAGRPAAIAVDYGTARLTYEELDARSTQLGRYLRRCGVGLGQLVGVYMERSVEMIVGMLGILKAGGAYLPLDLEAPARRVRTMLDDGEANAVLIRGKLPGGSEEIEPGRPVQWICLLGDAEAIASESKEPFTSGATGESLAYVMYTSGSTGEPKGVSVPQRAVRHLVLNTDYVAIDQSDVVAQASNAAFDAATFEIWGSLLNGAKLVGISKDVVVSPSELAAEIRRREITVLFLTTAVFHQIAREQPAAFAGLNNLLFGGEACDPRAVRAILEAGAPKRLLNMYGPTETTTFAAWREVKSVERDAVTVPIGGPVANTELHVLNASMEPVSPGEEGELYIGGDGLALGYWRRPELTAERFVPNPFCEGGKLYRSGDRVRLRSDGAIEFVGRDDTQVKLRGYRVELGEIEAVLKNYSGVRDAVVTLCESEAGEKRLVGYVATDRPAATARAALREHLRQALPAYMVPQSFVVLERFPLNANGKVDRRALPAPPKERRDDAGYEPPRTRVEEVLAEVWSELLGVEPVGIRDDFFDLGGHSLAVTQALSRIRSAFHVELQFSTFFEHPTIAELGDRIERARSSDDVQDGDCIPSADRSGPLPLSLSQERVWFLLQLHPANKAYNAQAALRFRGMLDVDALRKALTVIVERHEILRTTFPGIDGRPVQVIAPPWPIAVPVIDLSGCPEEQREAEAQRLLNEEIQMPFDVTRLPLARWTLWRLHPGEHLLAHVEHHLVHDGWSLNVFIRELKELYQNFVRGMPSPLEKSRVQFADFAVWQRKWMEGDAGREQLEYWKGKLAGCPPLLELPSDRPRRAVQRLRGSALRRELPEDLCETLRGLSRREGVSLFMTFFAAFAVFLHRYANQDDFCVGSGMANRRLRQTEGILGMIVNTVALRVDFTGDPSVRELLRQVRMTTLEAYGNQDLPFDRVVGAMQPDRSLSFSPIYQVLFSFHDSPAAGLDWGDVQLEVTEGLSNGSAKADLNVIVIPRSEQQLGHDAGIEDRRITLVWEYDSDLFDGSTAERMVTHYVNLLAGLAAGLDQPVSELPMLSDAEIQRWVTDWNRTETGYPAGCNLTELFEAEAGRDPDGVALCYGDDRVTRRVLNERANQLARFLRRLGIGPDVLAGLCFDRSADWIIGMLGIIKAGGAYVPLDASYPAARLKFMLEDAQAQVVVTEERLLANFRDSRIHLVCLDRDRDEIAREPRDNLESLTGPESLAYVMYTSGSTGTPKGVCVPHRAVSRLVLNTDYVSLGPGDIVAQASNLSFDAATFEIWGALLNRAMLAGIRKEVALSPPEFAAELRDKGITALFLTTALFNQVVRDAPGAFAGLKHLLFGGEAVNVEYVRQLLSGGKPERLLHVYGPTECTTFATWFEVQDVPSDAFTLPIGRPISNTKAYILDRWLKAVPQGVVGELYLGGDGLARGYWRRPQLTAEHFVANPFYPGEALYKTGDLVRLRADGELEFVGRNDDQVKLRGFRVELGEIEAVLGRHPEVKECVVILRDDGGGLKRLAAYVVARSGQAPEIAELRSHLEATLPEYMTPSAWMFLKELPLTPNGKVDRRALPEAELESPAQDEYAAPRNETEEQVAAVFCDILRLSRVGVRDSFFVLGGHSLLAMQIVSRLRRSFGVKVPLGSLFTDPTVEGLAARIESLKAEVLRGPARGAPGEERESGEL